MIVHAVELQDRFEFRGSGGGVTHNFFSCSQYGPIKLSGHEHCPGEIHMPEFLHGGMQIAEENNYSYNLIN